ncbi:TetR/AcrR family transcriptional regulator [Paenalcaligenes hominis]|uniref:TetR/AcrR family transcriptional regulator n=1 Tax=Paenalcaligenes hominis TaxID=643674 RepID=UPI003523C971
MFSVEQKNKPRRPGRPEGVTHTREGILTAAEHVFAEKGFSAPLREVAQKAKTTTSLINYYFESKLGLIEALLLSRGEAITKDRMERLKSLLSQDTPPTAEELVKAFLIPITEMRRTPATRRYLKLQSWLHMEPSEYAFILRRKLYQEATEAYTAALITALPDTPPEVIYWRYILTVGAYLYAASDTNRLEEISGGLCNPDDTDELARQVTAFVSGGFMGAAPKKETGD